MKNFRFAVIGFFVLSGLLGLAVVTLPTDASAAQYEIVLIVDPGSGADWPLSLYLNPIGDTVYSVNGFLYIWQTDERIPVVGTCNVESPNARFGLTILDAANRAQIWDVTLPISTLTGTIYVRHLITGGLSTYDVRRQ